MRMKMVPAIIISLMTCSPVASQTDNPKLRLERDQLYYERLGTAQGIPLVLVNGGPGFDHNYMLATPIWEQAAKRRPVILYDQRGTGRSPNAPAVQLTVSRMVEDLEDLRKRLKTPQLDLLGHSWGGILSMAYALRYPEHVHRMILVDSGSAKPAANEFLWDKVFPEVMANIPNDPSPAGQMGCVETKAYERMSYYDIRNEPKETGAHPAKFSQATCTAVMENAMKIDLFPQLRSLHVPTLVVNGRFDTNVAPSVAYAIATALPNGQLAMFERSGHSPFVEEPKKFLTTIDQFLDGAERSNK